MHQNIKNNYTRQTDSRLYGAHYYDYMIYKGSIAGNLNLDDMAIADFCDFDIVDGKIYSTKTWADAVNSGVTLYDIGLTGVDNGFIKFQKDRITNQEFLDLYFNSTLNLPSGDTRFFMTPVEGNTQEFSYPMYLVDEDGEKYIACKGGFYQGFFKLEGFDYQVLPSTFSNDITMHFDIRPRSDYEVEDGTVNALHPDNKGIFFYIGSRAENKFWPFYNTSATTDELKNVDAVTEGYFAGCGESGETYDLQNNVVLADTWLNQELDFEVGGTHFTGTTTSNAVSPCSHKIFVGPNYLNTYDYQPENVCCECDDDPDTPTPPCHNESGSCDTYFNDDYFSNNCPEVDNGKAIEDDYIGKDAVISENGSYSDSEGHGFGESGFYEFETDNKFLLFDRTKEGFTTKNWVEGTTVKFEGRKRLPNVNLFLLMNRTETGYTTQTIDQYEQETGYDYNLYKDIRNNAFALKITDDGAIGYRYGALDCDDEENTNKYKVVEEYSKPGLVKFDEWNSINIRFAILNPPTNKCDKRTRRMKIMFYVNGFLVFISKEMDAFNFKGLDEVNEKQEGVPYNISLGGGTLGLLETILPNYYQVMDYVLPLERDFCGTFLGDIRCFKIYEGRIDYATIKDYLS